jgi:methionyl-tRNA formyltransferase
MRIVLIGRTKLLLAVGLEALGRGHEILGIVTAKESAESAEDAHLLRSFAHENSISFIHSPNLRSIKQEIENLGPIDIGLSVNYVSIVDELSIANFRLGILNIHGGDLPRYRGNACQAWAIINGENKVGLCIHKMIGGQIDSGDIISREYLPIDETTYVGDVLAWINSRAPTLAVDAAEALDFDPTFVLEVQSSDPLQSLRTYSRRPEDGQINWTSSHSDILRLVRASGHPYSGAFAHLNGELVRIWEAHQVAYPPISSIPGQIVGISTESFDVSVGDGSKVIRVTRASIDNDLNWNRLIKSTRQRFQ